MYYIMCTHHLFIPSSIIGMLYICGLINTTYTYIYPCYINFQLYMFKGYYSNPFLLHNNKLPHYPPQPNIEGFGVGHLLYTKYSVLISADGIL